MLGSFPEQQLLIPPFTIFHTRKAREGKQGGGKRKGEAHEKASGLAEAPAR